MFTHTVQGDDSEGDKREQQSEAPVAMRGDTGKFIASITHIPGATYSIIEKQLVPAGGEWMNVWPYPLRWGDASAAMGGDASAAMRGDDAGVGSRMAASSAWTQVVPVIRFYLDSTSEVERTLGKHASFLSSLGAREGDLCWSEVCLEIGCEPEKFKCGGILMCGGILRCVTLVGPWVRLRSLLLAVPSFSPSLFPA
jgi:hypothetical protein